MLAGNRRPDQKDGWMDGCSGQDEDSTGKYKECFLCLSRRNFWSKMVVVRPEQKDGWYNISTEINKWEKENGSTPKYVFILMDGAQKYRDGPAKG